MVGGGVAWNRQNQICCWLLTHTSIRQSVHTRHTGRKKKYKHPITFGTFGGVGWTTPPSSSSVVSAVVSRSTPSGPHCCRCWSVKVLFAASRLSMRFWRMSTVTCTIKIWTCKHSTNSIKCLSSTKCFSSTQVDYVICCGCWKLSQEQNHPQTVHDSFIAHSYIVLYRF